MIKDLHIPIKKKNLSCFVSNPTSFDFPFQDQPSLHYMNEFLQPFFNRNRLAIYQTMSWLFFLEPHVFYVSPLTQISKGETDVENFIMSM